MCKTVKLVLVHNSRYYLKEFNWQKHVVCIRRLKPLSKLGKEWAPKQVCIEGNILAAVTMQLKDCRDM